MIKKINKAMMSGDFLLRGIKKIDRSLQSLAIKRFEKNIPIDNKKILFVTFQGKYTCNPKAIAEEILRQKLPYKLVWVAFPENINDLETFKDYPKELKIVKRGSYEFYEQAASAKVIVDNALNMEYLNFNKKKGQVVIQTWHGSLGLKKINDVSDQRWLKKAYKYAEKTDYCISNSKFETEEVYRDSYWKNNEILEYGHPRNDILFLPKTNKEIKKLDAKVRDFFNLDKKTKIFLYAPTFRESDDATAYDINFEEVLKALNKKFSGNWAVLVKLHFKDRKGLKLITDNINIINATNYSDIQELIAVSDIALTDYSSWICDWVLTKKPGFIFASDLKRYISERGFYYPLEETPFPIAETNDQLIENILNFDKDKYEEKRQEFLEKRGCCENGTAAKQVVELIKEIIDKESR